MIRHKSSNHQQYIKCENYLKGVENKNCAVKNENGFTDYCVRNINDVLIKLYIPNLTIRMFRLRDIVQLV